MRLAPDESEGTILDVFISVPDCLYVVNFVKTDDGNGVLMANLLLIWDAICSARFKVTIAISTTPMISYSKLRLGIPCSVFSNSVSLARTSLSNRWLASSLRAVVSKNLTVLRGLGAPIISQDQREFVTVA